MISIGLNSLNGFSLIGLRRLIDCFSLIGVGSLINSFCIIGLWNLINSFSLISFWSLIDCFRLIICWRVIVGSSIIFLSIRRRFNDSSLWCLEFWGQVLRFLSVLISSHFYFISISINLMAHSVWEIIGVYYIGCSIISLNISKGWSIRRLLISGCEVSFRRLIISGCQVSFRSCVMRCWKLLSWLHYIILLETWNVVNLFIPL